MRTLGLVSVLGSSLAVVFLANCGGDSSASSSSGESSSSSSGESSTSSSSSSGGSTSSSSGGSSSSSSSGGSSSSSSGGDGGTDGGTPPPAATGALMSIGFSFTCIIAPEDGTLRCFGRNDNGQLGIGSKGTVGNAANTMGPNLKAVNLGAGRKAVSVAAGLSHTCALLDDATLKCWGINLDGQLGLGLAGGNQADTPASTPDKLAVVNVGTGKKVRRVAAGANHTCVIRDDDKVVCWGLNNKGQLGRADTKSPVGEAPADMGDALKVVSLGTNRMAKELVAGDEFTCALLDDDSVKCWGENQFGQLGLNSTGDRGRNANDMGDQLAIVGLGGKVTQLRAGDDSVCALLADSSVKCWGHNNLGQVGIGTNEASISDAVEPIVAVNLGLAGGQKVVALGGGRDHHCAAISDGSLKCWGRGGNGQLGIDTAANVGQTANTLGATMVAAKIGANLKVEQLATGRGDFTCAALTDGANVRTYKCWGLNGFGQLGQENTESLGDTAGEMAALQAIKLK